MIPLAPDPLLPPPVPPGADASVKRDADRPSTLDQEAAPKESLASVRVVLSDDALARAAKARKAMDRFVVEAAQTRHDQARMRVAQIKQRIDSLKKTLMFLGNAASKAILRELRQLAGELGEATTTLKDSAGAQPRASLGAAAAPVVHDASNAAGDSAVSAATADPAAADTGDSQAQAQAQAAAPVPGAASRALTAYATVGETAMVIDADAADTPSADATANRAMAADSRAAPQDPPATDGADGPDPTTRSATESQHDPQAAQQKRQEDAQAVRDVIRAMRELLALLKSKLPRQDKEAQQHTTEVRETLERVEKTAQALAADSSPSVSA